MFQTMTPREYLKVDIANNFGLDKELWSDRIKWFDENESKLEQFAQAADAPSLYSAGVFAWRKASASGVNYYPISLDATASGLQISSCLVGDPISAKVCNVIDIGSRADAYTLLYNNMLGITGGSARIDRASTKEAIMTALYNSKAVPERIFGKGTELLDAFYKTMETAVPGAWELNEVMLALWNPQTSRYRWIMPDNFHVNVKVMRPTKQTVNMFDKNYDILFYEEGPTKSGRSLGPHMNHSIDGYVVRELGRRCNYDMKLVTEIRLLCEGRLQWKGRAPDQDTRDAMVAILWGHYRDCGMLSMRIIDYLNGSNIHMVDEGVILNLLASLPKKPFEIFAVHDCFRVLPNYGNDLRRQYNQLLSDIARYPLLSFLLSQITGKIQNVPKMDPNMWKDVLEANYALS